MGLAEIRSFLSYLNNDRQIAGSTYNKVREGNRGKDRITILPQPLVQPVREQIGVAHALFEQNQTSCVDTT
jgi:hypothetical protein